MSFLDKILGPIFGTKPEVPRLEELDLSEEQLKAIAANLKAAPEAAKLSEMTADQIDALIRRTTPNFGDISTAASENIESLLRGQVPKDVQEFLRRTRAAKALTGGYSGGGIGGMHEFAEARDLGLTSLELTSRGLESAESWLAASERLYAPAMSTYLNMFVTPTQQAAFDVEERNTQFQRSWLKNQIKAMPDPVLRGIHDTIMSLAVAYLGGSYQPQNAQQNYSAAGAGAATGGYNGGWGGWSGGGGYGTPGYGPGGGNVPPPAYGGYDAAAMSGVDAGGAMGGAMSGGSSSAMGFMLCWVARECYGENNPRWKLFRTWIFTLAPLWFFKLYLKYGERVARWLKNKPKLKAVVRRWMDGKIKHVSTIFY